jgi:MFS family permease
MGALSRTPPGERKRSPRWFYAYAPLNVASGLSAPLIPLFMVTALHASLLDVGLLVFFTSLAAVPGAILWGRISDRLHRRRAFVLMGLGSVAVTLPIMAFTRDPLVYFGANALLGLLQAAGAATATVLIMETLHPRDWPGQIGKFAQISGVAFVGGLVLGAAWLAVVPAAYGEEASLVGLFLVGAGLSASSVALGAVTVKEGHHRVDRQAASAALAHLGHSIVERRHGFHVRFTMISAVSWKKVQGSSRRPFARFSLGVALLFTGFLVFNAPLPVFLLRDAQLSHDFIFLVYLASAGLSALLYAYAGRRCQARPARQVLLRASSSRVAIYPLFAVAVLVTGPGSPLTLVAILALNAAAGAAWAFINVGGSVVASDLAGPEAKGQAIGVYNAAIGVGSIAGAVLGGLLAQSFPFLAVFAVSAAFIVAGSLTVATVRIPEDVPAGAPAPAGARHA